MIDIAYIAGTVVFFALMVAYTAACERIGRGEAETGGSVEPEV